MKPHSYQVHQAGVHLVSPSLSRGLLPVHSSRDCVWLCGHSSKSQSLPVCLEGELPSPWPALLWESQLWHGGEPSPERERSLSRGFGELSRRVSRDFTFVWISPGTVRRNRASEDSSPPISPSRSLAEGPCLHPLGFLAYDGSSIWLIHSCVHSTDNYGAPPTLCPTVDKVGTHKEVRN